MLSKLKRNIKGRYDVDGIATDPLSWCLQLLAVVGIAAGVSIIIVGILIISTKGS
ncbi:MAG: hypothetical protein M0R74_13900 [Dehalococcoidia bacterium]|nr:hypothetical protein [Dehalococcoidia bacterium]